MEDNCFALLAEAAVTADTSLSPLLKEADELVAIFTASRKTVRESNRDPKRPIGKSVNQFPRTW